VPFRKKRPLLQYTMLVVILAAPLLANIAFAQDNTITVEISGVHQDSGQIFIGLFNRPDGFPDKGNEYNGVFLRATTATLHHTFSGIPPGAYAIAVFHDSNENGRLDTNFFGIPKEGYGFSNYGRATFGPPGYDQAQFTLHSTYTARITLNY